MGIKKVRVKRLIKEFPNKNWSKRGVEDLEAIANNGVH